MGFLNDIKKLFFAQKSIAKSAVDKAGDEAEEFLERAKDSGKELFDKAKERGEEMYKTTKEKGGDLLDSAMKKGSEWKEKAEDKFEDLMDSFDVEKEPSNPSHPTDHREAPSAENVLRPNQSVPRDKTFVERLGEKTLDKADQLGHKALDELEHAAEKAKDLSSKIGEKVLETKDKMVQKSKEIISDLDKKLDETVEKAKKLDQEMRSNDADGDGFADTNLESDHQSTLQDKDDFFSKAEKFSKGIPMNEEDAMEILPQKEVKTKPTSKAYGFEDEDGDGNELIDDATIIED